jgi:hypothetical protein
VQFGLNFFPCLSPEERSAEQHFREVIELAKLADSLGYTHVREVEHYFEPYGGYSPNPIVFLTAVSQRTKTMRLVTGAVLPVFNHPFKLAGEIAMLDGISGGRLDVGFARAFLPHEFRRFGISIGHKDTDNVFVNNTISDNGISGVYLREESVKNSGHRNTFKDNKITNNGDTKAGYGFLIQPHAGEILIANNQIAETRSGKERTQRYGVYKAVGAGSILLQNNAMQGHTEANYHETKR